MSWEERGSIATFMLQLNEVPGSRDLGSNVDAFRDVPRY